MLKAKQLIASLLLAICVIFQVNAQNFGKDILSVDQELSRAEEQVRLLNKLKDIPNIEVKEMPNRDHFKAIYEVKMTQNLDHKNPKSGTFEHFMYLYHVGFDQPTIVETDGYRAYNYTKELSKMLTANQLIVEYRFYGKSVQGEIPYQYLDNTQHIEDLHEIVTAFKKLYSGKFISSGISKGGETALLYKYMYPKDVDATVAYVAPVILELPDRRTDEWQYKVGTKECRDQVWAFQRLVLERRDELIPFMQTTFEERGLHYTTLGLDAILEYAALEYPFSFWQWKNQTCEEIPTAEATAETIWRHFNRVNNVRFYSDEDIKTYAPFYYQMATEMGYYSFPMDNAKDLIKHIDPKNACFLPEGVEVKPVDLSLVKKLHKWLVKKGDDIIYIYGGHDTWTSCAVEPSKKTNALVKILPEASHGVRIKDFPKEDQDEIMKILSKYLGGINYTPMYELMKK